MVVQMDKQIVILIAQVKYPSSNATYLSSASYVINREDTEALQNAWKDFRSHVETDDFKIVNSMIYIVPREQVDSAHI